MVYTLSRNLPKEKNFQCLFFRFSISLQLQITPVADTWKHKPRKKTFKYHNYFHISRILLRIFQQFFTQLSYIN